MTDRHHARIVAFVKEWAENEKRVNPSFSLVVGRQAFTTDQIVEHIEEDTVTGKMLEEMILDTAASLFLPKIAKVPPKG